MPCSRGFIEDHLKYHASFLTGVLRWCPDPEHPLAASVYSVDAESKSLGHCDHAGFAHVISSSSATIIPSAFGFPRPEDVDVSDETEVLEKANVIKCDVRVPPF